MATYTDKLVVYNNGAINKIVSGDTLQVTGNFHIEDGAYDLDIKSHDGTNGLKLAGTVVTSTAAELNLVDGSSAGTIVNSKAVVYGSSGEVNATTLQIAGSSITATAAELNYLDITTLGTSQASKAVTVDSNGDLIVPDSDKFQFGTGSDMALYHDGTHSYITNSTGALKIATETSGIAITLGHTTSEVTVADNLTVTGDLTVNGTTTTVATTNTVVSDKLLELGNGTTGSPSGDAGIIIERGDSDNAIIAWDESADIFVLGTTTATGASTGNLTITATGLSISALTLGGTAVSSTAAEINLLDGNTSVGSSITIDNADGFIINDGGTMKSIPASAIKNYVNATPGGSVAADDVTAGDGNVLITTSSGTVEITATSSTDIVVDAPSGQSVDLQVNGTNVVEVAGGRVDVSQPLILTKAGVSLAPAAAHPAFSVGHVLAFEAGANGGLELADCDDTTSYLDAPFGVALETSAENNTNAIMVHTVHGGIVNVKIASSTLSKGQWLYLSTTAGVGTTTAPTSGMVWRLGLVAEYNASAQTDADIIWMPQFIADLG